MIQTSRPAIQTIRTTEELFLPDDILRNVLGLKPGDIIVAVTRKTAYYGKGKQPLDLAGTLVTVVRGSK